MRFPEFIESYIHSCVANDGIKLSSARIRKFSTDAINLWMQENGLDPSEIWKLMNSDLNERPKCLSCGRPIKIGQIYCSKECSYKSPEKLAKTKATMLKHYGCENISQSDAIKKKKEETFLKHYGVKCSFQSEEVKEKIKETLIERYGADNPLHCEEIKQKVKATNLERYGETTPLKNEDVKEKIRTTNLERYGCTNVSSNEEIKKKKIETSISHYGFQSPMMNDEIKEKIRKTNLEKYGVEHYTQTKEYKEKVKETCQEKYGYDWTGPVPERLEKYRITVKKKQWKYLPKILKKKCLEYLDTEEDFYKESMHNFKCTRCSSVFQINDLEFRGGLGIFCPECAKKYIISTAEKEIVDYIKEIYNGTVIENTRSVIAPNELDIWIPDKNLAIEYNGTYWHSATFKPKNYHLNKTLTCEEKGIRLIHIFDTEWMAKKEICRDIIKTALGLHDCVVGARECDVVFLNSDEYNDFFNNNHLQGSINASICVGLKYKGEIVSAASWGKSRYEKNITELYRFCCKNGWKVIGALSRLVSHSGIEHFLTYVDRTHFTGNGYIKSGFTEIGQTKPGYKWYKEHKILSRLQTQKHKLPELLGEDFDPELTEAENMELAGWMQSFDCGNLKMEWQKSLDTFSQPV